MPVKVNPIDQAAAQAAWLPRLLKEFTERNFPVRPVLVFPGWFVEPVDPETIGRAWVLEPKALPEFIEREPESIAPRDVAIVAFHLNVTPRFCAAFTPARVRPGEPGHRI